MALVTLNAPTMNSILNDGNLTQMMFQDTATDYLHYQARFYINNVEFDRVILPKITSSKMLLEFENLLLKNLSIPDTTSSTIQAFPMINELTIQIWKVITPLIVGGVSQILTSTFNYKLMYCSVSTNEKYYTHSLSFIGVDSNTLLIPENAMIQLPFHTTNTTEPIQIVLKSETNQIISDISTPNPGTSRTYLANTNVYVPTNIDSFLFQIIIGTDRITKRVRVLKNIRYYGKLIQFRNRFGMPMTAYLFGKRTTKSELNILSYKNSFNQLITAEVNEEFLETFDSGYYLHYEKNIIHQMVSSTYVRVYDDSKGMFIPCIVTTKNINVINENEFVESFQIQLKYNKYPKLKN